VPALGALAGADPLDDGTGVAPPEESPEEDVVDDDDVPEDVSLDDPLDSPLPDAPLDELPVFFEPRLSVL
jgi:hypothetical protein